MKKWLVGAALLLAIVCAACISALPTEVKAATYGDLTYIISNEEVTITDCNTSATGELAIPDTIEGYPVTRIGSYAFQYCSSLTSVAIPDSVTSVGDRAFAGCYGLTAVHISDIAAWCGINFVGYESNPLFFAGYLYVDGTLLTNLEIPEGVVSIGKDAFYRCRNLFRITIPSSVTNIGTGAFAGCDNLGHVHISDLSAWCEIEFADSSSNPLKYVADSGEGFLYLNGELQTDIVIPEGTTRVSSYAFYEYYFATSITIPDSVTSIGDYAFWQCEDLQKVSIGSGLTSINTNAFDRCYNLTKVVVDENNENLTSDDASVVYNKDKTALLYAPAGISGSYTIPNGVTHIDESAFSFCASLTEISIPDSVVSIGNYAFNYCYNLTSINMGEGVITIGDYAFRGCDIESINFPDNLVSIGHRAFTECTRLCSVTFSDSTVEIDWEAFYDCLALQSVIIPGGDGTIIGAGAFDSCYNLTDVTLGDGVIQIDSWAFSGCGFTSITIPDSVTSIGNWAFGSCDLINITIPKSVTNIGESAFAYCEELEEVIFMGDAPSIGSGAITNATCYYDPNNGTWTEEALQQLDDTVTWIPMYKILEGGDSVIEQGKEEDTAIRVDGEISDFVGVTINGETVDPSNYTVTEGSTIITFRPEFLKTLKPGSYTVAVVFEETIAATNLAIEFVAMLGDADSDKEITTNDAALLKQYRAGLTELDDEVLEACDVSGNGKVDAYDAYLIQLYVAGVIDTFPCEN